MNDYSEGLRHGYEDQAKAIRKILAEDISDAEKLKRITWRVEDLPFRPESMPTRKVDAS